MTSLHVFGLSLRKWNEVSTAESLYSVYVCIYPYFSRTQQTWVYASVRIAGSLRAVLPEQVYVDCKMNMTDVSPDKATGPTSVTCVAWRPLDRALCAQVCPHTDTQGRLSSFHNEQQGGDHDNDWYQRWNEQMTHIRTR